jgi:hypothetical protein
MNRLFLLATLIASSSALAADPAAMNDADLNAAFRICLDRQTAGGGTLAGQGEIATMCDPVMKERNKRVTAERSVQQKEAVEALKGILKK